MLKRGQLAAADDTGFHHFLYARCPNDGRDSPVYMPIRTGGEISRLFFRCTACGTQFEPQIDSIFLR
jgi:hypothetical protein